MFLGTAHVGKSSLKRSLMKKPFDKKILSTIVCKVSTLQPSFEYQTTYLGDDTWIEVTDDDELNELAQLLLQERKDSTLSIHTEATSSPNFIDPLIDDVLVSEKQVEDIPKKKVNSTLKRALQNPNKDKKRQPFFHLWDCGGQPVFLEILPAFLTPRTMFLLMFNASKPLNSKWHSVINSEGEEEVVEEVNETTLEMLLSWMANIHSHLMTYDDGAIPEYPRMYCIGTHGDQLNKQKKTEVKDELESHYQDKIFAPLIEDTLLVDNTTSGKGEFEDPNFAKLRRAMYSFTSENLIVETPVSWVLFRIVIQQYDKNVHVIDLKEAHSIGKACKIPFDDVPKVLLFYHDLGVLLFYPYIEELKEKVIVSPQWFVDILGRIFTLKERDTSTRTQKLRDLLYNKGILVQPYYHEKIVWKGCEGLNPNSIMELLLHFHLAAEVRTEEWDQAVKHYFVPAVLKSFHEDPDKFPSCCRKHAVPLHIIFPTTKLTPPGFFTRLATTMASCPSCKLFFKDGIYRNRVTFLYGISKIDHVVLTDLHYAIQVNVLRYAPDSCCHQSFNAICQELLTVLEECVTDVRVHLIPRRNFGNKISPFHTPDHVFKFVCGKCYQPRYVNLTFGYIITDIYLVMTDINLVDIVMYIPSTFRSDSEETSNPVTVVCDAFVLSGSKSHKACPHYLDIAGNRPKSDQTIHCEKEPDTFRPLHPRELFWFETGEVNFRNKKILINRCY